MSSPSATPNTYPYLNEPKWSRSEKTIAHKVFDVAQERELQQVIQEAKQKADQIKEPADLWDLEHYLTQRRKEINGKYDYRYSQLDLVFGRLLREKWIDEEDLRGLREDKLRAIRSFAKVLRWNGPSMTWF